MALIACERVVTGLDETEQALTLEVREGRIVDVRPGIDPAAEGLDGWLVPGFVDTHCHGALGADFTDVEPGAALRAVKHHRSHGTTTTFATTNSSVPELLVEQVAALRPLVEAGEIAGIHVQAPFLEAERKGLRGAAELVDPEPDVIDRLLEAGGGAVRMVTLDPTRRNVHSAIRRLQAEGVVAAFGNTRADTITTRRAVAEGVTVATHLFTDMKPIHHLEPGPVPVLLTDERVAVELVCDGRHVAPEVAMMAIRAAGPDRVILVSDAMQASGLPDGEYELRGMPVLVRDGQVYARNLDGTPAAPSGSTLTMDEAFARVVQWGVPIVEAARMAATTPARVHALPLVGSLCPGHWADACLVDDSGLLQRVMRRGDWLDEPLS